MPNLIRYEHPALDPASLVPLAHDRPDETSTRLVRRPEVSGGRPDTLRGPPPEASGDVGDTRGGPKYSDTPQVQRKATETKGRGRHHGDGLQTNTH